MEGEDRPAGRNPLCPSGLGYRWTDMIQRRYWITPEGRRALEQAEVQAVLDRAHGSAVES